MMKKNLQDALIRETLEEAGLKIIPSSISEYGFVQVVKKGRIDDVFVQDNYYYLVDVYDEFLNPSLSGYEIDEEYELQFIDPSYAINTNKENNIRGNKK